MRPKPDALPQPHLHQLPALVAMQGTRVTGAGSFLRLFLCSVPSPWVTLHQDESGPTHQGCQQVGQSRG